MGQNDFPNLPGVITDLQDGGLQIFQSVVAPVVLILGTATSGPSEVPFSVGRAQEAAALFGTSGTLIRGMYEAKTAGAQNVVLFRINATAAELILGTAPNTLTITTIGKDNTIGDDYSIIWDETAKTLKVINSSGTVVYDSINGVDLGEVIVEGTISSVVAGVDIGNDSAGVAMSAVTAVGGVTASFTAGTDGVSPTKRELYEALFLAYEILEDAEVDIVIPMEAYLDDANIADDITLAGSGTDYLGYFRYEETDGTFVFYWSDVADDGSNVFNEVNFAQQLGMFCYRLSRNENNAIGVIGVNPPAGFGFSDVSAWIGSGPTFTTSVTGSQTVSANGTGLLGNKFMAQTLTNSTPGFFATVSGFLDDPDIVTDNGGNNVDIGKYLSITPAWVRQFNAFDTSGFGYISSAVTIYGGFISTLQSKISPINKVVPGISMPFRMRKSKLDALAGANYTMFTTKPKGTIVSDAPTAAASTSDYQRLTTTRIVHDVIDNVRAVADPFIGNTNTALQRTALQTGIDKRLQDMQKFGFIQRFEVQVTATTAEQIAGTATVEMVLVPAFELRKINVTLSLVPE